MGNFLKNIFYFLISIVIVVVIFVGIIGLVMPIFFDANTSYAKLIAIVFAAIGSVIIVISRKRPLVRFISFIKKPVNVDTKMHDYIGSVVLGLSILLGGVFYYRFKNPNALLICLIVGAGVIRLLLMHLKSKNKKSNQM